MNLGSLYLVFLYLVFCFGVLAIGQIPCCRKNKCPNKVYEHFTGGLLWNGVIEFIVQSYMEICFSVILQT
jgi:hypothetical protein